MRKFSIAYVTLGFLGFVALVPPAISQDVRNTYIGIAAQVADGILTNAKLASMANSTVKCRITSSTGVPEDCSGANINTITGVTTNGTAAVGQLPGTTTNDAAAAGKVGEFVTNTGTGVNITSGITGIVVATAPLGAGDWECSGNLFYSNANTTVTTLQAIWTGTSSTFPATPAGGLSFNQRTTGSTVNASDGLVAAPERYSLAAPTSINLYAAAVFTVSTLAATGTIRCWRRR